MQPSHTLLRVLTIASTFLMLTVFTYSQTPGRDIVYLRNGSVIKGIIIEQVPNKTVKIQTADGSIFVYDFSDIERIEKESVTTPTTAPQSVQPAMNTFLSKTVFSIHGGVAIPLGEFASTTGSKGGAAKLGFAVGADLRVPIGGSAFWLLSGTLSSNSIDEQAIRTSLGLPSSVTVDAGSWLSITPLTGVGFLIPFSETTAFLLSGRLGLLIGTSPNLNLSSGSGSATQSSSSATAFAYGFSAGIVTNSNFSVCVQFHSGQPKYTTTASGGGISYTSDFEQPMSLIQIVAAIGL